ncbi:MAG: hypothetical protein ACQGVC_18025 [Myxococcota bacterium]
MSDDGNVIEFPRASPPEVQSESIDPRRCRHLLTKRRLLHGDRVVRCECGSDLDTFDVLAEMVDWTSRYREQIASDREECEKVQAQLGELRREEARIKARARRAERGDEVHQERVRIVERVEAALDRFCDGFAQEIAYDRAEGILWGFREVVAVFLFDRDTRLPKATASRLEAMSRRIHAAGQEIDARRRRRGIPKRRRKAAERARPGERSALVLHRDTRDGDASALEDDTTEGA